MKPTSLSTPILIGLLLAGLSGCGYEAYSVRGLDPGYDPVGRCSLLLDAEIRIWSDFDGAVLPDVDRSAGINAVASNILIEAFQAQGPRSLQRLRQPLADKELLDEYLALYSLVSDQALLLSRSAEPRWQHRRGRTDLGVGPGLADLVGGTVCGTAIVLKGFQLPASESTVLSGAPLGRAVLSLGLLDLGGGEIIWVNQVILPPGSDLSQGENLRIAIDRVLKGFPVW